MQSIFRLPWCSEPKMPEKAGLDKMRQGPVVEIPVLHKLKRKRTDTGETDSPLRHPSKKPRPEDVTQPFPRSDDSRPPNKAEMEQTFATLNGTPHVLPETNYTESPSASPALASSINPAGHAEYSEPQDQARKPMANLDDVAMFDAPPDGLTRLQQVIENEFNMQILMKHNELRLIEQELAKCQIALEQLRRVELRPFPGSSELSQSVSSGTGASIVPPPGFTKPIHSAPHGVTDGPYSRHYNQWLLHDPQFDSTPIQTSFYGESLAGRSTRNSGSARKSISKPFVFPGRPADTLQSIPNYPVPPAKDKTAPLFLKRSTDNQWVKLICNNCLRGNFSSIQGFLNHCRIAHKVDYKSHDLAAIDCGRPLDEQELANFQPEMQSTPSHKPSLSRISTTSTSTPNRNLVHPLNTTASASVPLNSGKPGRAVPRAPVPSLACASARIGDSTLTPSSQVPRLSAHFAKHQLGGDLATATANARQKVDLGIDEDVSSPDVSERNSPLEPIMGARTVSGNGRASLMAMPGTIPRPASGKGIRQPARPRPSPLADATPHAVGTSSEIPESPQYHAHNLSPNTADSNPGLVSDHEDDDHGSASEEEAPQAEMPRPFGVSRTCADNVEIDVAEDDDIDRSGLIGIRRNSMFAEEERGLRAAGSPSRKFGLNKRGA